MKNNTLNQEAGHDPNRRALLGVAGLVVPPVMITLLSTGMASPAIAASGGGAVPVTGAAPGGGSTQAAAAPAIVPADSGSTGPGALAGLAAVPVVAAIPFGAGAAAPAALTLPLLASSPGPVVAAADTPAMALLHPAAVGPIERAPPSTVAGPIFAVAPVTAGDAPKTTIPRSTAIAKAGERG